MRALSIQRQTLGPSHPVLDAGVYRQWITRILDVGVRWSTYSRLRYILYCDQHSRGNYMFDGVSDQWIFEVNTYARLSRIDVCLWSRSMRFEMVFLGLEQTWRNTCKIRRTMNGCRTNCVNRDWCFCLFGDCLLHGSFWYMEGDSWYFLLILGWFL